METRRDVLKDDAITTKELQAIACKRSPKSVPTQTALMF